LDIGHKSEQDKAAVVVTLPSLEAQVATEHQRCIALVSSR
jgi:hypothetical protein